LHAFNIWWTYRCKAYLLLIEFLYSDTNFLIKKKVSYGVFDNNIIIIIIVIKMELMINVDK
jgi:hypothetical protein